MPLESLAQAGTVAEPSYSLPVMNYVDRFSSRELADIADQFEQHANTGDIKGKVDQKRFHEVLLSVANGCII